MSKKRKEFKKPTVIRPKKTERAPNSFYWRPVNESLVAIGLKFGYDDGQQMTVAEIVLERGPAESFAKWIFTGWSKDPPASEKEPALDKVVL